ncbi:response regulator transcription factor [Candidatus Persebacteraceae bacterium Df01]|jgi:OmpR family response regulator RpaB|uniref:Response regulator transcription factor n=1 Tax=Candidatus Doriopsillibacter californiensis TaxID=2970740 RepID=A0ABT7QLL0_9GAMM|nr:response regulator transcription factor [Candidatus Persebacteraceae bacterium Df01]
MDEVNPLLLVDDDVGLGDLLSTYLGRFGFSLTVAQTPSEGLELLASGEYKGAIFDVMLPEMDGFELCKIARRKYPRLPIMMLTARGDMTDRVVGLEIGADDYLPKPFEPRELAARLTALLRRAVANTSTGDGEVLYFEGISVHLSARRVWLQGNKEIILTSIEFRVLSELVRRRPAVVHRDVLIEEIRGFERDVFDRSIDIAISRLRAKLHDTPQSPRFVQTVRSEGYAFIAPPASA